MNYLIKNINTNNKMLAKFHFLMRKQKQMQSSKVSFYKYTR